jgi:hypothetical protein
LINCDCCISNAAVNLAGLNLRAAPVTGYVWGEKLLYSKSMEQTFRNSYNAQLAIAGSTFVNWIEMKAGLNFGSHPRGQIQKGHTSSNISDPKSILCSNLYYLHDCGATIVNAAGFAEAKATSKKNRGLTFVSMTKDTRRGSILDSTARSIITVIYLHFFYSVHNIPSLGALFTWRRAEPKNKKVSSVNF